MESEFIPEPEVAATPPEMVAVPEAIAAAHPWQELGEVLWLSLPIIITMLSYTVMNFADVVMVGRHSPDELAAVGPAGVSFFLFAAFLMGTLSITNTFVGQSVGRGEKHEAPRYVWQAMYLALAWGLLTLSMFPLAPLVFRLAGHAPEVQPLEVSYFRYLLFRVPAIGCWSALAAFYQATKRPVVPMVAALIANSFNFLGNYVLIFGKWGFPEMGISGAALATVLGTYLQAALMMCAFLSRHTHREYGTRSAAAFSRARLWRIIRVGLPAGVNWCLDNASWAIFLMVVVGGLGSAALAANNATVQIMSLSFMPVVGLNIGVQSIVGHHIGMGDHAGAKRRTYRALALAVGFMLLMGVCFLLFRHPLISLFSRGEPSPEILRMGGTMLIFAAIFQAFDAFAIISYGALKGAGDTRFPMFAQVACAWLVFIPLAFFLTKGLGMGVTGAWLAVTVNIALVSVVNFWRFASDAWHKIDIFRGTQPAPLPETAK